MLFTLVCVHVTQRSRRCLALWLLLPGIDPLLDAVPFQGRNEARAKSMIEVRNAGAANARNRANRICSGVGPI
jgi:hypothetical protein